VKPLLFRPFDRRVIYDETNLVGDRREPLREHLSRVDGNLALVATRSATPEAAYLFVTRIPGTQALLSSRTLGAAVYFPFFVAAATGHDALIPLHEDEQAAKLNLDTDWERRLREAYAAKWSVEAFQGYLYGVLGSETYRERFAGQLEDGFPRIPFPADAGLFAEIAECGSRLIALHLLEGPISFLPRLEGRGDLIIGEARHDPAIGRLWINQTQFFEPVTATAWASAVGGYAVVQLWLRNHRGRRLSGDEARELARIIGSVTDAEGVRVEIDCLVDELLGGQALAAQ
jgi:hypothetical protein